jgi:hypothetical protein
VAIAGQPDACAGVGPANARSNQTRVFWENGASGSIPLRLALGHLLTLTSKGCSVPHMARKNLTTFLIALSDSIKLRDKFRDPVKRARLLEQWDLTDHPALQEGATIEEIRAAVVDETGLRQVEWWIRVAAAPELNEEYDPDA